MLWPPPPNLPEALELQDDIVRMPRFLPTPEPESIEDLTRQSWLTWMRETSNGDQEQGMHYDEVRGEEAPPRGRDGVIPSGCVRQQAVHCPLQPRPHLLQVYQADRKHQGRWRRRPLRPAFPLEKVATRVDAMR